MPRDDDRAIIGYTFHVHLSVGIADLAEAERFVAEQIAARFGTGGDRGEAGEWHHETKGYPRWQIAAVRADYAEVDPY